MSRSSGTCNVMGTASTMASMVEALGLSLPENAAIPAVDSRRYAQAHLAGRRIVELVEQDIRDLADPDARGVRERDPRQRRDRRLDQRRHPPAGDGRPGRRASCRWRTGTSSAATCRRSVDLMPSGRFLMEDFYYAGGLPAVIRALGEHGLLNKDALTVNGKTIWENCKDAPNYNPEVIRPFDKPLAAQRRHRRAQGQPVADRRGAQALGGIAEPDDASRPRGGVREHRALQRADQGSRSRRRRQLRAGDEELRPEGLSRDARGRQHGAAAEGAADRRHRHGAHLRRAHERHGLRHRRAARLAGSGRRRPAGAGA